MGGCCGAASRGLETSVKVWRGNANQNEEDNNLRNPRVSFVSVEDGHPEDGNHPADERDNDDADDDRHAPTAHGRKQLTADDAGNGSVPDHNNHIKEAGDLCRPVPHKVSSYDLIGSAFAIEIP